MELVVYTEDDYLNHKCLWEEVGKPKYDDGYAKRLARQSAGKAMDALVEVVAQNDDLNAKVKAAQTILDRGFGKPDQHNTSENVNMNAYMTPEWMKPTRHAYQLSAEVGADVLTVGADQQMIERNTNWNAALVDYVEANPTDHGARHALAGATASRSIDPALPPPEGSKTSPSEPT